MSSTQSGEDAIRRALIEGVNGAPGVVDCMVALPGQLFYSTQIPVCLWFLARDKSNGIARNAKLRDRRDEILFIDARKLGHMVDRTRKEFSDADIEKITRAYHAWRGEAERRALRRRPWFLQVGDLWTTSKGTDTCSRQDDMLARRMSKMTMCHLQSALQHCKRGSREQFAESDGLTVAIREKLCRSRRE